MKGMFNKVISINLTTKETTNIELQDDIYLNYLGGRGLGVKLFTDRVSPKVDALSPDNKMVFTIGPLTGTAASTSGRMALVTKSPLTGTIFYSNTGGMFGFNFKRCGIDGLIVEGASDKPVYLLLDGDNGIQIKDASMLWGLNTEETYDKLIELQGPKSNTLMIGQAGEHKVLMASIMNNAERAFGRGGVGAVMGSKNLKAIVVKNGTHKTVVDNPELMLKYAKSAVDKQQALPVTRAAYPLFGTAGTLEVINGLGMLPIKNFTSGQHEKAKQTGGEAIRREILVKTEACYACSIKCGRLTEAGNMKGKGPEYETVWALGANCEVFNLVKIAQANYYCNMFGIDTITMGVTISCAMELQEMKLLPYPEVTFGNEDVLAELVRKTAFREGIGNELAEGSKRLAEKFGNAQSAIQVKGLELPAYDPRGAMGHALGYATSNRGGCHLTGYMAAMEIFSAPKRIPRFTLRGKADLLALKQNQSAVEDSLVSCKFAGFAVGFDFWSRFTSTVTGLDFNISALLKIGERIYNLERLFNVGAGFTELEDVLPERFAKEVLPEGLSKDRTVNLETMLADYYAVRNWDEHGVPQQEKLNELGLHKLIA